MPLPLNSSFLATRTQIESRNPCDPATLPLSTTPNPNRNPFPYPAPLMSGLYRSFCEVVLAIRVVTMESVICKADLRWEEELLSPLEVGICKTAKRILSKEQRKWCLFDCPGEIWWWISDLWCEKEEEKVVICQWRLHWRLRLVVFAEFWERKYSSV